MTAIGKIKGMTPEVETKLRAIKIIRPEHLLEAGCNPAGRSSLAEKLGIEASALTEYLNRVDLARVKGIGEVFANLLEEAGVDTVKELAHRVPEHLEARLAEINLEKKVAGRKPRLDEVAAWVAQARELPKILEY